jgi:hypothetical protein
MKETSVGIPFTDVAYPDALPLPCFLDNQPSGYVFLDLGAEVELSSG